MAEVILPGTYITVRDEGLITAGRVTTGNIGIVGTASKGPVDDVQSLSSFSQAKEMFGETGKWDKDDPANLTLIRALEQVYNNGGRKVFAVRVSSTDSSGSTKATQAGYQTKDETDDLVFLKAKTPGTWGNDIKISITDSEDEGALASEEIEVEVLDDIRLQRDKVVAESDLNSIILKQKSTGVALNFEIVYDGAVDDAKQQVNIDAATGVLTFTKLSNVTPAIGDMVIAGYEVPPEHSKKVRLAYRSVEEAYFIADASHLAELINRSSALAATDKAAEQGFYTKLPANTSNAELFGTSLNGTPGSDGADAEASDYKNGLALLENELINIVLLAGQDASNAGIVTALMGHLNTTAGIKHERIGVIGSSLSDVNAVIKEAKGLNSGRLIFAAPGLRIDNQDLPGTYMAAAVAGLIASLPVQTSPTNKALNIPGLAKEMSSVDLESLVLNRVLAIEKRNGYRIVKGITTATNTAWHQITTRRIVDYAIYGVRSGCNPYIGKLNNDRVRGAMKATLDAFLTRMVENEALISYELEVTATRAQQIAGEAIVTMTLRPTFSIDFIKVTMYLG